MQTAGWRKWARRQWHPRDVSGAVWACNLNAVAAQMTLVSSTHISVWSDQYGGRHGSQGTDAARLIYNATGGPNGRPCVDFSAGGLTHVTFGDVFSGLTGGAEIFIVRKVGADPPVSGAGSFYSFGSSGSSDHVPFTNGQIFDGFASTARKTINVTVPTRASMANWHIWNVTSVAGNYTARLNGAVIHGPVANTVGWSTAPLLGKGLAAGSDGGMTTMWIANGALNAGDRAAMHSWLNMTETLGLNI